MQPAPDNEKKAQVRVFLTALCDADLALLIPAGELLTQFEVSFERMILGNCTGEIPDLSLLMRKAARGGVQIVILASRQTAPALAVAASVAAPVIRVPVPLDQTPQAALAALTGESVFEDGAVAGRGAGAFATVALGEAGARNAALLAVSILALTDARLKAAWQAFRDQQTNAVLAQTAPCG